MDMWVETITERARRSALCHLISSFLGALQRGIAASYADMDITNHCENGTWKERLYAVAQAACQIE